MHICIYVCTLCMATLNVGLKVGARCAQEESFLKDKSGQRGGRHDGPPEHAKHIIKHLPT